MKRGANEEASGLSPSTQPVTFRMVIEPTAPAIPPKPTTEPTACFGNVSEAVVNRLADQPWCAAAASPTRKTATHMLLSCVTIATGMTHTAQTSSATLRPKLIECPPLMSREESQPPPTEPTSAST